MIQPNKQTRRRLTRKQAGRRGNHGKDIAQMTTNAVLWQIIKQSAPRDDEGQPLEGDPYMMIPHEELKNVPTNFSLEVNQTSEGTIITAKTVEVKVKSNIILPGKEIIS